MLSKKTTSAALALCFAIIALGGCERQKHAVLREDLEYVTVQVINHLRNDAGLQSLELKADLREVARRHNANMIEREYAGDKNAFDHRDADGKMVEDRLDNYQNTGFRKKPIVWVECGENLARNRDFADPVAEAIRGWLASEEHKKNIMSNRFRETGVAVHESKESGTFYFTQVFVLRMPE
ncbi:MAG: hypothetical protein JXR97_04245 [Planctomycetes bacterium]|nr:hypothetical protein [Planctomycetota bacterium]